MDFAICAELIATVIAQHKELGLGKGQKLILKGEK